LKLSKYWVGQAKNICVSTNILEKNRLPVGSLAKLKKKKKVIQDKNLNLTVLVKKWESKLMGRPLKINICRVSSNTAGNLLL
jgi:hypothetical protein